MQVIQQDLDHLTDFGRRVSRESRREGDSISGSALRTLYGINRDRGLDQLYDVSWTYIEGAPSEINALAQNNGWVFVARDCKRIIPFRWNSI